MLLMRMTRPSASFPLSTFISIKHLLLCSVESFSISQTRQSSFWNVVFESSSETTPLKRRLTNRISLWRPLNDIVLDRPLAVCDSRSIRDTDLVEADHIRRHYNGSNYYALPSRDYKWWYLSGQQRHEVTIFKNFDSDSNVSGRREWT